MWTAASSGMMMMLIGTNHAARRITTLSLCLASGHQAVKVKLVCITLAVHLGHDILVVIVSESSAQFVVVHVWLRLAFSPTFRHLVWVDKPKLPRLALPADTVGIRRISEQLQQKLPKLYLPARALSDQSVRGSI